MQIVAKARFIRAYRQLPNADQRAVDAVLRHFERYLQTQDAPPGLGVKHFGGRTYEFRAGLARRVVYLVEGQQVVLALLGTHDEVRRFLKKQ